MALTEWIGRALRTKKEREAAEVRDAQSLEVSEELREAAAALRRRAAQIEGAADRVSAAFAQLKVPGRDRDAAPNGAQ